MIKFKEINGKLFRMVGQPCHHCGQPEIIAEPVKEGSAEWALYQMMQGLKVCNPQLAKDKAARLGCDDETFNTFWYIVGDTVVEGKSDYGTLSVSSWIAAASSTGWQLYEPKQEPPKEPGYIICKRCGGSQSVPNPAVSNTAYTTCPKCGGTGYEIKEQKKEPEKESPIDPIERPLRSLILKAKEEGKNIRTYCQDMVFTPVALTGLLANGRFRWWNICNWELTDREQNYYPQISYDEHEPEPFANVKVGDYLELSNGKPVKVANVTTIANQHDMVIDTIDGKFWGYYWFSGKPICCANSPITRILKPSEVVVDFGSFKGRVKKYHGDQVRVYGENDINFACVAIAFLDPATADLVRDLIEKQKGDTK